MKPFSAPVEEILFTLEHVAGASRLPDWDGALYREIVQHFAAFAEGEVAPVNLEGDQAGCKLEAGQVNVPSVYHPVYRSYVEQGWPGLTVPECYGGQGLGATAQAAVSEIFTGACHALQMSCGLVAGAVRTLLEFGSIEQKEKYLPLLANGNCLSTMCLTEPGAGSDLSAIRCRAQKADAGWLIDGEKIFISGGGQNLSGNIFHLVLARSGSAADGVKGLSLFACLNHTADDEPNGITVTRIEEKMGIHGSPTCQIQFEGTRAELIGEPGAGLKAMFTMMNHARLDVALQGVAHAARAHDIARHYASERRQGRQSDGISPATISQHADVGRMLETQDALALGCRSLCLETLVKLEQGSDPHLVEFLTPVCKVFCTEAGIESANLGIQILGGYGYLKEYTVEQVFRDARITAIYEGANGIHSMALASRLIKLAGGACADAFASYIADIAAETVRGADLEHGLGCWSAAKQALLTSKDPGSGAHWFMKLTAELAYLGMWAKLERVRQASPFPERIERLLPRVYSGARKKMDYLESMTVSQLL